MLVWIVDLLCKSALYAGVLKALWLKPPPVVWLKPPLGIEIGAIVLATRLAIMVIAMEQKSHVATDASIDVEVFLVTVE